MLMRDPAFRRGRRPLAAGTCRTLLLRTLLLVLGLGSFLTTAPLSAQIGTWESDALKVTVRPLFPGGISELWRPVLVEVRSTSTERQELELRLRLRMGEYTREHRLPLVLPAAEVGRPRVHRQIVPLSLIDHSPYSSQLMGTISLRSGGRALKPRDRATADFVVPLQTPAIVANSPSGGGADLNTLVVRPEGVEVPENWRLAYGDAVRGQLGSTSARESWEAVEPRALPSQPDAYDGIHRVLLFRFDPGDLAASQREALRAAVRLGREVWVLPGEGGEGLKWFGPEVSAELRSYGDEAGRLRSYLWGEGDPGEAIGRSARSAVPSWLRYPDGLGSWVRGTHTGVPPDFDVPLPRMGTEILTASVSGQPRGESSTLALLDPGLTEAIDSILRRSIDPRALFLLVVVYLVVAGPLLFFYLRHRGRLHWLLWLQPTVVACFLLLTGIIGWSIFGVTHRVDDTYFLVLEEGRAEGVLLHYRSEYSSVSGRRSLASGSGATLPLPAHPSARQRPLQWSLDGEEAGLVDYPVPFWGLRHFVTARAGRFGEVSLSGLRNWDGTGAITSTLPFPLGPTMAVEGKVLVFAPAVPAGDGAPLVGLPDPRSEDHVRVTRALYSDRRDRKRLRAISEFDPGALAGEWGGSRPGARGFLILLAPGSVR